MHIIIRRLTKRFLITKYLTKRKHKIVYIINTLSKYVFQNNAWFI